MGSEGNLMENEKGYSEGIMPKKNSPGTQERIGLAANNRIRDRIEPALTGIVWLTDLIFGLLVPLPPNNSQKLKVHQANKKKEKAEKKKKKEDEKKEMRQILKEFKSLRQGQVTPSKDAKPIPTPVNNGLKINVDAKITAAKS